MPRKLCFATVFVVVCAKINLFWAILTSADNNASGTVIFTVSSIKYEMTPQGAFFFWWGEKVIFCSCGEKRPSKVDMCMFTHSFNDPTPLFCPLHFTVTFTLFTGTR